jgi:hypothetical protein
MVIRLLFPLHSWHCCVQTESNTARWQLCGRGIGGKRLFEGNDRDTKKYPLNCVGFRQGIERGYRSENCLSVRMYVYWLRCKDSTTTDRIIHYANMYIPCLEMTCLSCKLTGNFNTVTVINTHGPTILS